jgi:hypothetical protein
MLDAKGDSGSLSLADVHGRDGGVEEGSVSLGRRSEKTIEARRHGDSRNRGDPEKSVIVSRDFPNIKLGTKGCPE